MKMIFMIILAALSAVYLVSLFFRRGIFQSIGKACLVPLIAAVYITGSDRIFPPVILALFFGWLGDIFLLKIEDIRFFRLGLGSFLVGHILYIPSMMYFSGGVNITALAISALVGIALGILIFRIIRPNSEMKIPVIAYETVIILMAASAVQLFIARGTPFGAFAIAGGAFFLVSDTILAFFTFQKKPRIGDFLVMLTYISAQLCIVLGFSGM